MQAEEFKGRKAAYAPVSAFQEFLEKMPNVSVPGRADQGFLRKLNIARGNEWALLSALKFLAILDQQGEPTPAYRRLLSSDQRADTLHHLVETAYAPLLSIGGLDMSVPDLVNYFRVASSPSQARNAARFFQAVARMAGFQRAHVDRATSGAKAETVMPPRMVLGSGPASRSRPRAASELVVEAKARLLDKLPAPRDDWSAAEYRSICDAFLEMLRHLDA